ncbi:site-specific integrase [Streptomyces sp. NPDC060194]|uniref:site-specific integrase n=1 Tax=Streptomyces sp. NPDC060194 TaxID=3347069 RepID=UPI0036565B0A
MAAKTLVRGMGTFFKDCEHPQSRWSRCAHEYRIRYRNLNGRQVEESGFTTQDAAITRLTSIYNRKRESPHRRTRAERARIRGEKLFKVYAAEWRAGQRDLSAASQRHLDSLLEHHLLSAFAARRMSTFDHKVVDAFVKDMEAAGVGGRATQANAFDKLKSILLDAHRLGIYEVSPLEGIKPPQYQPKRVVIPTPEQLRILREAAGPDFRLVADLMSGCGMRNAEAVAVNLNLIIADDVYRIQEQVNQTTGTYGPLKHRRPGGHRDVPLPRKVRETMERYAEKFGDKDGCLLRHPAPPGSTAPPASGSSASRPAPPRPSATRPPSARSTARTSSPTTSTNSAGSTLTRPTSRRTTPSSLAPSSARHHRPHHAGRRRRPRLQQPRRPQLGLR